MMRDLLINWNPCWFVPCLIGFVHVVLHIVILFLGFKIHFDSLYNSL